MKQINLIPWREQARERRKREFFNILAAALLGSLLLLGLIHSILANSLDNQNSINNLYQQQITQLNQQLSIIDQLRKQQKAIVERISIIDKLQATRSQVANIFSDMVKALPPGVYLVAIRRLEDTVTIVGKAESNARISMFMRNLEVLPWLEQVSLSQIQTSPANNGYANNFALELKLKSLRIVSDMTEATADKGKPAKADNKAQSPAKK